MHPAYRSQTSLSRAAVPWGVAVWAAVCGVLVALLVFAPAAWLAQAVATGTQGRVVLADAKGSVWRGSAQLLLAGGAGSEDAAVLPGRMDWRLRPIWLGAAVQLDLPCCAREALMLHLRPGWSHTQLDISPARVNLPAQWLAGLGAPWNTLSPQGQLSLVAPALQVQWLAGRTRLQGQLTVDMLGMSSRLSTLSPLGDYRLTLAGGDVPSLSLQTLQGALQLSGNGQLIGSRIRFKGEASAADAHQDALANVLNIIGRRQGAKSLISVG